MIKRFVCLFLLSVACVITWPGQPNTQVSAPQTASSLPTVTYKETSKLPEAKRLLETSQVLNLAMRDFSQTVKSNHNQIEAAECGEENAYYMGHGIFGPGSITYCYELLNDTIQRFQQKGGLDYDQARLRGLYAAIADFFHEMGHAVIQENKLPITGSEEDAADQFSIIFLLKKASSYGVDTVQALILRRAVGDRDTTNELMNDEHRLSLQRSYNALCLLWASDENRFESLVNRVAFSPQRKESCRHTYETAVRSWEELLFKPHKA